MLISHFRIKNFRSIIDSGWISFSPDGVTVLIGKNESGKSAILEALATTFNSNTISADDIRHDNPSSEISYKIEIDALDIKSKLTSRIAPEDLDTILKHLGKNKFNIIKVFEWCSNHQKIEYNSYITEKELYEIISSPPSTEFEPGTSLGEIVDSYIFEEAPYYEVFNSKTGLLPDTIEISSDNEIVGTGEIAAKNFLAILNLTPEDLLTPSARIRHSKILQAIDLFNSDLQEFWSQTVGKKEKIKVELTLERHDQQTVEHAGKPYIAFWVSNGTHRLHPKQRSSGVQWFLSFYLQLRSSQASKQNLHFLLDEPGANLHINAQKDILSLINKISSNIQITYTTHSPALIENDKLYRVHAVQRSEDDPESPTSLISALHLGSAARDTLTPILAAIGSDLTHNTFLREKKNILLEEISGFYYLSAFWDLFEERNIPNFIPATGVTNIPILANMFLGWGLDFGILIDDDKEGRNVYKQLKANLCGGNEDLASSKILKIKNCSGIEDIFEASDFEKHITKSPPLENEQPSSTVKRLKISKPLLAYTFSLKVKSGEIRKTDLHPITISKISELIEKTLKMC